MSVPDCFGHYLAAWNELDVDRIRSHLDRAVVPDVLFVDPANTTTNIDELEAMIRAARTEMPDATYGPTTGIDGHNDRYRYRWEVRRGGELFVQGMDFVTLDGDRLARIDGFFGDFAPPPAS